MDSGSESMIRLLVDDVVDPEMIQKLFEFSQYQDELFSEIVDAVESVRGEMGWKETPFYMLTGMSMRKWKAWVNKDIHKFFLSDIAYIAFIAGLKIKITMEPAFERPTKKGTQVVAERAKKRRGAGL